MAVSRVQAILDGGGWNGTITGVVAGNSLIQGLCGDRTGTASITSVSTDNGGPNFTQGLFTGSASHGGGIYDVFAVYHLHNANSGTHNTSASVSGFTAFAQMIYEVSGVSNAAPEATNTATATATTSHPTNSVTTAGEAFLLMSGGKSTGAITSHADWVQHFSNSGGHGCSRVVTSGGTYNGDWTTNVNADSGSVIAAYAGAAAAGGNPNGLALMGVGN